MVEAMKGLQLRRWGGCGALIVICGQRLSRGVQATGLLPPACSPGSLCDQQRQEPAAMGGPGASLRWTLHLGHV